MQNFTGVLQLDKVPFPPEAMVNTIDGAVLYTRTHTQNW